eukprot:665867-Rhodomonas_salina.2
MLVPMQPQPDSEPATPIRRRQPECLTLRRRPEIRVRVDLEPEACSHRDSGSLRRLAGSLARDSGTPSTSNSKAPTRSPGRVRPRPH